VFEPSADPADDEPEDGRLTCWKCKASIAGGRFDPEAGLVKCLACGGSYSNDQLQTKRELITWGEYEPPKGMPDYFTLQVFCPQGHLLFENIIER
jgi:hypothetical protein